MTRNSSRLLWQLSGRQHGVVTRAQLLAHGLTSEAIRHRLREGRLHPIARGVYAVGRPEISREGRWLAATLSCGPDAVLSHASAAALWGVRDVGPRVSTEVVVPTSLPRRRPGIRVHRAQLSAADITTRRGVPVVSPARMLLHQAPRLSTRELEADINTADALGLVSPEQLRLAMPSFAGQTGAPLLRELIERHSFTLTDSELERRFLPVARRAGLERPLTQEWVNGFRVDFFWPRLGLVVETNGLRYHRTPAEQARDLLRDQAHKAAGLETLRFTHHQVVHGARYVERTLRAVAARRDRERLPWS